LIKTIVEQIRPDVSNSTYVYNPFKTKDPDEVLNHYLKFDKKLIPIYKEIERTLNDKFTKEHFEKLFRDPNPAIRAATVLSNHFGKEHVEEAFSDPSELVREAVVHSRHFGHQHLGRALNDRNKHVRRAAERKFNNALI
jgi:hypothetical protein